MTAKKFLRVISYNIHKGFSAGKRRFVLHDIREALKSTDADMVFLQEVLGEHRELAERVSAWPAKPQFEFLAEEHWSHVAYGKNAVYVAGHHGNAILSKHPILRWENYDVSTNSVEARGVLHAVVQTPSAPVHCFCIHLGLSRRARTVQLRLLLHHLVDKVRHDEPVIIAGDFNDWSEAASRPLKEALRVEEVFAALHGKHARTFPAWCPSLKLDRIYIRNITSVGAQVLTKNPWRKLSDHAALQADLHLGSMSKTTPVERITKRKTEAVDLVRAASVSS